jgi:tetratricopeptide (TPR) repeat protein
MSDTPAPPFLQNATAYAASTRRALLSGALASDVVVDLLPRLRAYPRQAYEDYSRACLDAGLPGIVVALLQDAVLRWPDDAELYYWLGNALRGCGQIADAEAVFRMLLQNHPDHEQGVWALAFMLRDAGRIEAAAAGVVEFLRNRNSDIDNTLRGLDFLEGCRRFSQAAQICEARIAAGVTDPRLQFFSGQMALVLGEFGPAREHLLAALDNGLDVNKWSGLWLFLSSAQRYTDADHIDLQRFQHASQDTKLDPPARAAAAFALGKAYDDLHRYADAARAFDEANALARTRYTWSEEAWRRFVETQLDKPLPPVATNPAADDCVPVFVVGLPRTGTTLIAELLGRHPQVCNRGERSWIPFLAQQLSADKRQDDPVALRAAAATYLKHLHQDDAPAHWYIDKNPLNFRHLGLISTLFPNARIIHCRRDPRDTALSIWCQMFAHEDNNFAYDWSDIAAFAAGEERLMRHWQQSTTLPVCNVDYQQLTGDPEATLLQLAQFLGLPEHDLLKAPSKQGQAIATASVWQARQPVYRSSIGRWQAYEPYIPELSRIL